MRSLPFATWVVPTIAIAMSLALHGGIVAVARIPFGEHAERPSTLPLDAIEMENVEDPVKSDPEAVAISHAMATPPVHQAGVRAVSAPVAAPSDDVVASDRGTVDATFHFALPANSAFVTNGLVTIPANGSSSSEAAAGSAGKEWNEAAVSVRAHLISSVPTMYPAAARDAEIETDVPLAILVDVSGAVIDARATKHVGYGLEEAAVRAIRQYRFSSALREGLPVRVRMAWTVEFRLR